MKARWVTFDEATNMNSNSLPNHTSGSEVNVIEKGKGDERVLKATMENIYEMMIQTYSLSNLIKTQCLRDLGKFLNTISNLVMVLTIVRSSMMR
jgi:hypothetical protein